MSNIKAGDRALFGKDKVERIFIAAVKGEFLAVVISDESYYLLGGKSFEVIAWESMEELPKPKERRYRWLRDGEDYTECINSYMSDAKAERDNFTNGGWYKDENDFIEVEVK